MIFMDELEEAARERERDLDRRHRKLCRQLPDDYVVRLAERDSAWARTAEAREQRAYATA